MKATLEIPDALYRKVKTKSAREGRRIREVAVELLRDWVGAAERNRASQPPIATVSTPPPWFGSLRKYAKNARGRHDMTSIRRSIARGRAAEWAERENGA